MEKNRSRAIRRHHEKRIKDRARWILTHVYGDIPVKEISIGYSGQWGEMEIDDFNNRLIKRYNNFTNCSCWMCGNPRQTLIDESPLTMAERKAVDRFQCEMDELDLE